MYSYYIFKVSVSPVCHNAQCSNFLFHLLAMLHRIVLFWWTPVCCLSTDSTPKSAVLTLFRIIFNLQNYGPFVVGHHLNELLKKGQAGKPYLVARSVL